MMNEAEKLEWFELQLRLKTIEVMLGPRYREALALTLGTLYTPQRLVAMAQRLGVSPEGLHGQLEKIRLELNTVEPGSEGG
ncbi:hypothetical protein [Meiothermus granaticius]|uniref:Uncharacterized protein n=1 Tax=Meiothermus granaticius NBRC 107808 TaxID=1227551 RepID=A0A399F7I4_9DEIN|nr:hypothetical protein [Meiothermus granaticius]MCL6525878.1 hypothetical protein [Thermaceae bacterium]RIH92188.1 hypothetical protein Mgrana_01857 [Meiothermus granaticius NBRC 107808]GEM85634.1 hypothetical protein MGR01S_02590 [Meiothermus granaticius NBRC 107808]